VRQGGPAGRRGTRGTGTAGRVSDLVPDPENRRKHNPRNIDMIAASMKAVGTARSIVIDENDVVLAGNGVVEAAAKAGISGVRIVEAEGNELIAVRRRGLTADQKRDLAIADNRAGELSEWNLEQLRKDIGDGVPLEAFWRADELAAMAAREPKAGLTDPDMVPDLRATDIQVGQIFALGPTGWPVGMPRTRGRFRRCWGPRCPT